MRFIRVFSIVVGFCAVLARHIDQNVRAPTIEVSYQSQIWQIKQQRIVSKEERRQKNR